MMKSSSSSRASGQSVSATVASLMSCDHTQSSIASETTTTIRTTTTRNTNDEHGTNSKQQTANSEQTASNKRQTANGKQQTANGKRQTVSSKQQAAISSNSSNSSSSHSSCNCMCKGNSSEHLVSRTNGASLQGRTSKFMASVLWPGWQRRRPLERTNICLSSLWLSIKLLDHKRDWPPIGWLPLGARADYARGYFSPQPSKDFRGIKRAEFRCKTGFFVLVTRAFSTAVWCSLDPSPFPSPPLPSPPPSSTPHSTPTQSPLHPPPPPTATPLHPPTRPFLGRTSCHARRRLLMWIKLTEREMHAGWAARESDRHARVATARIVKKPRNRSLGRFPTRFTSISCRAGDSGPLLLFVHGELGQT